MFRKSGLLQEHASELGYGLQVLDLLIVVLAACLSGFIYLEMAILLRAHYIMLLVLVLVLTNLGFNRMGIYQAWRSDSVFAEIGRISITWAIVLAGMSLIAFYTKSGAEYSRVWAMLWFSLAWAGFVICRIVLRYVLRELRKHGFNQRRIMIIGKDELASDLALRLTNNPWMGLQIVDSVLPEVLGIEERVIKEEIDQVWITLPFNSEAKVGEILQKLSLTSVEVRYVPDLFSLRLFSHSVTEVAGLPIINLSGSPMVGFDRMVKAFEDRVLSLIILVLISPLIFLIAILVKLSSAGPIFFKQERLGWGGKPFEVLKFRSMVVHQEPEGVLSQAKRSDPRVTKLGFFLRRTSLDELPQFFNVLKGEMSIVGPRPHAIAHNDEYKAKVDDYMLRHRVKPGITGWAQIHGYRGETDTLEKMQKRVEYDLYYIENWSLLLDLQIIFLTMFKGFINKNAH